MQFVNEKYVQWERKICNPLNRPLNERYVLAPDMILTVLFVD